MYYGKWIVAKITRVIFRHRGSRLEKTTGPHRQRRPSVVYFLLREESRGKAPALLEY